MREIKYDGFRGVESLDSTALVKEWKSIQVEQVGLNQSNQLQIDLFHPLCFESLVKLSYAEWSLRSSCEDEDADRPALKCVRQ